MQKVRVLHVTFDMAIAGTEQVIFNLITNLDPEKYTNSLFCIEEPLGAIGQKLSRLGYEIKSYNRKQGFDSELLKKLRSVIKKDNIDIVHCHQYSPFFYGVLASLGLGKKVIFTEHGRLYPDIPSWKRRLINPLLQSFTDRITCISKATIEALVQVEAFSRRRIQLLYNGVCALERDRSLGLAIRERLGIPEHAFVLGTVSRLDPIKNQPLMLNAFAQIVSRYPNSFMIFVGDGSERVKLEQLAVELGIRKNVVFAGFQVNPSSYFNAFDVFLLTSFSEGTSMTLLEAMSCGVPCVATNVGGNPEVLIDGRTGLLIPSDDAGALIASIDRLFQSEALRASISENAIEDFQARFDVKVMADAYADLYSD